MLLNKQRFLSLAAVCGALAIAGPASAQAAEPSAPGVVRITDRGAGIRRSSHDRYRVVSQYQVTSRTPS